MRGQSGAWRGILWGICFALEAKISALAFGQGLDLETRSDIRLRTSRPCLLRKVREYTSQGACEA